MEKIKFSDVANLYLGCKCMYSRPVSYKEELFSIDMLKYLTESGRSWSLCKPLLRKLESMTEDEENDFYGSDTKEDYRQYLTDVENLPGQRMTYNEFLNFNFITTPGQLLKLLNAKFDLFSLIENGEAVELKQSNQ